MVTFVIRVLDGLQVSDDELQNNAFRVLCVAGALLLLETFIIRGPPRTHILRTFLGNEAQPKKASRLVSQLAARLIGCLFLVVMDPVLKQDKLYARSDTAQACVIVAAGYFLYDVFICLMRFDENGLAFLIHALGCCTVFTYAALHGILLYYGVAFLMWELSTPFVYVRWVLLKLGLANSRLFFMNNLVGFLVFISCRNIYGPLTSWDFYKASSADLASPRPGSFQPLTYYFFWVMCILLNGLNYYWAGEMIKLAAGKPHPKHAKQAKQS
ncbi:hypothetical protein N2152v2_001218 [Parachlorella kessleri]